MRQITHGVMVPMAPMARGREGGRSWTGLDWTGLDSNTLSSCSLLIFFALWDFCSFVHSLNWLILSRLALVFLGMLACFLACLARKRLRELKKLQSNLVYIIVK